ncbi:MAG: GGDEF domain-containing protein [Gammaproteobacteria bacterium]|nr:MAG: GGDEF domain-containing protein [Gammaproteobacteria bacterium]
MAREDRTVLDDGHPLFITEHQLTDSAGQTHILQTSKMRLDWFGEPALLVVSVDISEQVNARRQIARLSFYDSVTNLANRTLFMDHVRQAIQNLRREGRWGGLAIMDLDDFKTLNDIHGHGFGDTVIRHVAQHLALHVPDGTLIGRLGGDEFGLLLPATRDTAGEAADDHRNTLNNLLNTLAEPVLLGGQTLRLHATAGLVLFPDPQGCDADTLLRYADTALFHAKQALRGQVCLFQPRMAHEVSFRVGMEQAVCRALTHKEFVCFFQPKVSIPDGRIIGAEMLARWQDPDKGLIPPDTFIPVLEATGLIEDMSYQLLDQALAQLASWKREGLWPAQGRLAINISPRQFGSPDFAENILNRLAQHRLSGDDLELEVTESILIRDMRETVDTMNVLRAQGIRFAIDDFGTGYSSLAYLKRLPVRMLKIDRSFVRDMEHDPNDAAIVATIIAMADHLNMEVVAEGVETREQLDLLRQQKCTAYQGYLFSAPVDAPHMTHLLQDIAQLPPSAESS